MDGHRAEGHRRVMVVLRNLAESWRTLAARRLERSGVEDWNGRLTAPPRGGR